MRVDSAPWLRFTPCGSRPSWQPPDRRDRHRQADVVVAQEPPVGALGRLAIPRLGRHRERGLAGQDHRGRLDGLLVEAGCARPPRRHHPSLPTGEKTPSSASLDRDEPVEDLEATAFEPGVAQPAAGDDEGPWQQRVLVGQHGLRPRPVRAVDRRSPRRRRRSSAARRASADSVSALERVAQRAAVQRGDAAQRRRCDRTEGAEPPGAGQRGREQVTRPVAEMRIDVLPQRDAQRQQRASLAVLGAGRSATSALSAPRKFRKRRSAGSNAAPRNRSERQALSSTAPQPSSGACSEVDEQRPRDVVRAVPERVVRDRPDRVLPDPERARDGGQVRAADRVERVLSHRRPRGSAAGRRSGTGTSRGLARRSRRIPPPPRARSCRGCRRRRGGRSPLAPRGSRAARTIASASASGEPGVDEPPAAAGEALAGVGVGRGDDGLAGPHRVGQGARHDLVEVGIRRHEDVGRLEPGPELRRAPRTGRRSARGRSRRGPRPWPRACGGRPRPRAAAGPGAWRRGPRRAPRGRRGSRPASPRSRTRSPCPGRAGRSSGSPGGPPGRGAA